MPDHMCTAWYSSSWFQLRRGNHSCPSTFVYVNSEVRPADFYGCYHFWDSNHNLCLTSTSTAQRIGWDWCMLRGYYGFEETEEVKMLPLLLYSLTSNPYLSVHISCRLSWTTHVYDHLFNPTRARHPSQVRFCSKWWNKLDVRVKFHPQSAQKWRYCNARFPV